MRPTAVLLGALALLASAAPLTAQSSERERERIHDRDRDRDVDDDDAESTIDTTVALGRGAVVDLSLVSGEIIVTAWNRQEARVHATSEHGRITFEATSARLSLDVRGGHGGGDTRYEVTVPVGTRVLAHSVSGDQQIRGTKGEVEARTISGELEVDDVLGLVFESVSGDVRARHLAGDVSGNTVSGEIELADAGGDVRAESTSGDVTVDGAPRAKVVRLESVSGTLSYTGAIDRAGRYDFTSHSGDVTLALPGDVGAQLGLETFSGDIQSDFAITTRQPDDDRGPRRQQLDVTLGGGGARITVSTFSGDINLERARARTRE